MIKIKKQKAQKYMSLCNKKKTSKFQSYKNCLEAAQIENKINHLEKNKINVDSLKEFVKNNKVILKTQQRFKNEKHNVLTEEIKKIALSSNDDKRMQSIDSIEILCVWNEQRSSMQEKGN